MIYDYIALDVETTGLNPSKNRVLEIGAVKVLGRNISGSYSSLINTGVAVSYQIQKLTGITDAMRESGKRIGEVFPEFLAFCQDLPIVGHNVQFDFGFLKQEAANLGLIFEKDALDTLRIARQVLPDLPSRSLEAMCRHYHVDQGNAHRALDDAMSAHYVLQKLWEEFGEKEERLFVPRKMIYSAKKQSPITNSQKGYLNDLLKYHKIELNIHIEDMTKSEASRMIDEIILHYGRITRRERMSKDEFLQ